MSLDVLLRGVVLGFSIAAPVGPIGVLCIHRTLTHGRATGFVSGLGAATADALYGCMAVLGLSAVSAVLLGYDSWLRLVGRLYLCALGVRTLRTPPTPFASPIDSTRGLIGAYISTLLLTLTNPATIFAFIAIFAGVGISSDSGSSAALLVLGVFVGSALWWLLLSGGVGMLRTQFASGGPRWINLGAGIMITLFGIVALVSLASGGAAH